MEVDMFAKPDEDPPITLRCLTLKVYADLVSDAEARNIAVGIQEYLDSELIEWKIDS